MKRRREEKLEVEKLQVLAADSAIREAVLKDDIDKVEYIIHHLTVIMYPPLFIHTVPSYIRFAKSKKIVCILVNYLFDYYLVDHYDDSYNTLNNFFKTLEKMGKDGKYKQIKYALNCFDHAQLFKSKKTACIFMDYLADHYLKQFGDEYEVARILRKYFLDNLEKMGKDGKYKQMKYAIECFDDNFDDYGIENIAYDDLMDFISNFIRYLVIPKKYKREDFAELIGLLIDRDMVEYGNLFNLAYTVVYHHIPYNIKNIIYKIDYVPDELIENIEESENYEAASYLLSELVNITDFSPEFMDKYRQYYA